MGLMGTPGGRSRMMRGAQNRPSVNYNHAGAESGPPERLNKSSRPVAEFLMGLSAFSMKRSPARSKAPASPEVIEKARPALAIDPYMAELVETFRKNRVMIVQAPTGTGKSIGISEAIVKEGYKLIVTNPRRIGAVMLAEHLAHRDGSQLGERFGYRHGRRKEAEHDCQAVLTTEGYHLKVLLNQLKPGSSFRLPKDQKYAVMWDEAHERTAKGSMLLYLCKEMMLEGYDIKLVISSATLDPKPIVDYFAKEGIAVPVMSIPAKHHPIKEIKRSTAGTIIPDIVSADRSLTFVHGKGAIAALMDDLNLADPSLKVIPLHAELSHREQQEAVQQINSGKGRIAVLSTNWSQASVTFDVDRVISTGLVRRERVGEDFERHLAIEETSQSEEQQKKGRVGRLREGEWCYRGGVALDKLAPEIPHEIENCQLEPLILQTLAAGRDFSEMNNGLLFRAPDAHVERAMEALYQLDLIGPRGNITRTGKAVAELPTEVRTGKALVLAMRHSEQEGLAPEQLILPTIDMISCVEAKGIVTWESVSAPRGGVDPDFHARHGRWTKLLNHTHRSDPIAQMELFRTLLWLRPDQFHDWGVHINHFNTAVNIREQICERLNIDPFTITSRDLSAQQIRNIKEFYWAGSIDRLYRFVGRDGDDSRHRIFKPVANDGRLRMLSRDSVVKGSSFVVAEPITIDREYGDVEPARLLVMASAVDSKWLANNTPPQLKNAVEEAMDKAWEPKQKAENKQKFHRPGMFGRRR
jgi:hypothetical protein